MRQPEWLETLVSRNVELHDSHGYHASLNFSLITKFGHIE
jgi:hypothetical protein